MVSAACSNENMKIEMVDRAEVSLPLRVAINGRFIIGLFFLFSRSTN